MKKIGAESYRRTLFAVIVLLGLLSIWPSAAGAQTINAAAQGDNAVWLNGTTIAGSWAFIDASVFTGSPVNDLCGKIFAAISALPSGTTGSVIDARGINTGGNNSCTNTPWFNGSTYVTTPTDILLPSGKILMATTWVLPDRTRIFGEGNNPTDGTAMQACTTGAGCTQNFTASTPMVQFGISTGSLACPSAGCSGIAVQDIYFNGAGLSINGIQNSNAGDLSYVDHVNLHSILGTALAISGSQTTDSGPYSNIASTPVTGNSGTVCVELQASGTRGIHGLTCTADGTPSAGILLDGSNNTLEDVHMEGFGDAIRIGSNANAQGNVLLNVNASDGAGNTTNVIHICGPNTAIGGTACPTTTNSVSDMIVVGTRAIHINSNTITNNIQDDVTATLISWANDPWVSLYALGNAVAGTTGGNSRYTSSTIAGITSPPPIPTWGVGALGATAPSGTCPAGSLFSNTTGTASGNDTLWVCVGTVWKAII